MSIVNYIFILTEKSQISESDKENTDRAKNFSNLDETDATKDIEFVELDEETLGILGESLGQDDEEFKLHPNLAEAWKKVLLEGDKDRISIKKAESLF